MVLTLLASFLSELSLTAASNRCAICGAPFGDTVYTVTDEVTHEKKQICYDCSVWPQVCYLCGLPVRKDYIKLPDGRFLCARDAKTAVLDDDEAKRLCEDVIDRLDRMLSRFATFPRTNVEINVIDRVNLLALFKVPGNDYDCPDIVGYFQARTNQNNITYSISLMSALPRADLEAVCAHEYSHAWVSANVPLERKKTLGRNAEEGFCELVAYLLMNSEHEDAEAQAITRNNYTRGQIDLFIEAEKRYGVNEIIDWMRYGVDAQLDKDDLNRVRTVVMPPSGSKPSASMMAYIATPPPAPDTLTLKGIFWSKTRPVALINGCSFGVKDEGKVPLGSTNVTIRCLAVRENSVLIQVVGSNEQQELRLPSK